MTAFACTFELTGVYGFGVVRNSPIGDAQVTLPFGYVDALHPASSGGHGGIDLVTFDGQLDGSGKVEIRLLAPGTVRDCGYNSIFGNYIIIRHDDGDIESVYMHRPIQGPNDVIGKHLDAGDLLGYEDTSGLATGPHLHWGIQTLDGVLHNPINYFAVPAAVPEPVVQAVDNGTAEGTYDVPAKVLRVMDIATADVVLALATQLEASNESTAQFIDGGDDRIHMEIVVPRDKLVAAWPGIQLP